jgi:hypothetical protein
MRNRRSVGGNQKASPEDFRRPPRGRFFVDCFDLPAALGILSPPAESLAGNPNIRRNNRFASCETDSVHAFENCQPDPAFFCGEPKKFAGNVEFCPDFLRCGPPVKSSAENPASQRLLEIVGGISALWLEIRIVS